MAQGLKISQLETLQELTGNERIPVAHEGGNFQVSVDSIVFKAVSSIVDGSPDALNTLKELSAALSDDADFAATITDGLSKRVRFDNAEQGLTLEQKTNVKTNIGLTTTDDLPAGTTNLYFSNEKILDAPLTGAVKTDVTEPTPLDSVKVFLGKLWGNLFAHMGSKNNPHDVTVSQIGAAATNHAHSMSNLLQSGALEGQSIVWNGTMWSAQWPPHDIGFAASDEMSALSVGTNKTAIISVCNMHLLKIKAVLSTPQISGALLKIDIRVNGISIFSVPVTFDNGETVSTTALTPYVLSANEIAENDRITVDILQVGDGTGRGLKVFLIGYRKP